MNEIRLLDANKDADILTAAWNWRYDAPKWFQESLDIWKETFDEYLASAPKELHYGVFTDREPQAIIRLVETEPYVFNIHLSAKRKTDFNVLLQAGLSVKYYLFDQGVRSFFGWLPTLNRGVSRLYENLGFRDSGIRIYKGQIHGKTVEWLRYEVTNENLLLNKAK